MKLIATREVAVNEIAPDEGITHEGKRYVVDEVHRSRDGFSLSCISEENPSVSRRKTISFDGDAKVVVEAGEADRRMLISMLNQMLSGDVPLNPHGGPPAAPTTHSEYYDKDGALTITLGPWTVGLEA